MTYAEKDVAALLAYIEAHTGHKLKAASIGGRVGGRKAGRPYVLVDHGRRTFDSPAFDDICRLAGDDRVITAAGPCGTTVAALFYNRAKLRAITAGGAV